MRYPHLQNSRHLYIGNDLWEALRAYGRSKHITTSRAVRNILTESLGVQADVRGYVPDGKHTQEAIEEEAIARIFAGLR